MMRIKSWLPIIFILFSLSVKAQWKSVNSGSGYIFSQIIFADSLHGYIIGVNSKPFMPDVLLGSSDGGYHWKPILYNERLIGMDFLNKDTGALVCKDTVYKTFDGGKTWDTIATKCKPGALFHMNSATEWFYVIGQHFGHTLDGGLTWIDSTNGNSGNLPIISICMQFIDDTTIIGFGAYGPTIFQSNNKGLNWVTPSVAYTTPNINPLTSACIPERNSWYLAGSKIVISTDWGKTWKEIYNPAHAIANINYSDPSHLYAVGQNGYIIKSNDSGHTWAEENSGSNKSLSRIIFLENKAIAIGDSGTVLINTSVIRHVGISPTSYLLSKMDVYPNPCENVFKVETEMPNTGAVQFELYNSLGRKILSKTLTQKKNIMDLNQCPVGIYFYKMVSNGNVFASGKVIKEN